MQPEIIPASHPPDIQKIFKRLIIIVVTGILAHVIFIVFTTESAVIAQLNKFKIIHLAAIVLLMHVSWTMYAFRLLLWSFFLKEKISFPAAFKIVITSEIASAISPTSVGGAPVKAGLLLHKNFLHGNVGFILTYGVMEDMFFYLFGIVLSLIFSGGILFSTGKEILNQIEIFFTEVSVFLLVAGMLILLIKSKYAPLSGFIGQMIPNPLKHLIQKFRENLSKGLREMKGNYSMAITSGKKYMVMSFVLLLLQWMAKFSILVILLFAFQIEAPALQVYIKQWIVHVMMLFIPTPGASGGAEASFLLVFGKSIPENSSFIVVSAWRFFTYYLILVVAMITFIIAPLLSINWLKLRYKKKH